MALGACEERDVGNSGEDHHRESQMWIFRSKITQNPREGQTVKLKGFQLDLGTKLTVPPTKVIAKNRELNLQSKL